MMTKTLPISVIHTESAVQLQLSVTYYLGNGIESYVMLPYTTSPSQKVCASIRILQNSPTLIAIIHKNITISIHFKLSTDRATDLRTTGSKYADSIPGSSSP
jgi:hypothetical protein